METILSNWRVIFIRPKSDHCLPLSGTDSLLFSRLDVTLAFEDTNSKLLEAVISAADVDADDSSVEISNLRISKWS